MAHKKPVQVKPHFRKPPGPRAPSAAQLAPEPGPNEFDAGQEQAMRQGQRQANQGAMPPMVPDTDNDGM